MRRHRFGAASTSKLYHVSGVEIDIWKDEHADEIISRAQEVELAGRTVRITDAHDLIAMKLRAGRLQDDYDISEILRARPIDEARVRSSVTAEEFKHFLDIKGRA
jgi:predicted nucleotidyltransferase